MRHPRSFAAAVESIPGATTSSDISRRAVLGAGAAGALMATGLASASSVAALTPKQCSVVKFTTVVTPPHTQQSIHDVNDPKFVSQAQAIQDEARPFAITPRYTNPTVALSSSQIARMNALQAMTEIERRDRLVGIFLERMSLSIDADSPWKQDVGVGPSTVTLYCDAAKTRSCATIQIPGVPVKTIQDSIDHMKTDMTRCQQIQIQVDLPHVYLAAALGIDQIVLKGDFAKVNWTCQAINCVGDFASKTVLAVKNKLNVPRPQEMPASAPDPIVIVPKYSAYPAGHATFLAALHVVLCALTGATPSQAGTFRGLTDRIAENRERAGLHTRVDTRAGQEFGAAMGQGMLRWVDEIDDPDWGVVYACARNEWT